MKRILVCLIALLLALCACDTPDTPPSNLPTELSPIALPSAQTVADWVTLAGDMPSEPDADALAQAVDARITALLADLRISVNEPASSDGEVLVSYFGVLQEPLSPKEELDGVLQATVRGEARIPVWLDPDALVGREVGDSDIPLNILDPSVFSLDAYQAHTILFHVQILAVYRAPKDLAEAETFYAASLQPSPIDATAIYAEERARLLWQEALSRAQSALLEKLSATGTHALPGLDRIAEEYIESHRNRYLSSGTSLTFSKWLSLHTSHQSEDALSENAAPVSLELWRSLFTACAVLDACNARQSLPDYTVGCAAIARDAGYTSVRFFTWQIGGSAAGWQRIIEAHCISVLSSKTA